MKSLIIDKQTSVELKNSKICTPNHTIPLALIDLLILTQDTTITPANIIKISNENIPILYLSRDSKRFALTLPAISKNSELKIMQYRALSHNIEIAKQLLHQKFLTHQASLNHYDMDIDITNELTNLALAKDIDTMMGVEGSFARRYFGHYFSLFERKLTKGYRSKNPPLDPINATLSYIYTLGYNTITAKLYMRGFDPSISYLHIPFRSHYALSSDLMELFRADINDFVADLFLQQILTIEDFSNKGGIYLKQEPRRQLWKHIKPFMDTLNPKLNKAIANLKKQIIPKAA